jgi:hypothetical protein
MMKTAGKNETGQAVSEFSATPERPLFLRARSAQDASVRIGLLRTFAMLTPVASESTTTLTRELTSFRSHRVTECAQGIGARASKHDVAEYLIEFVGKNAVLAGFLDYRLNGALKVFSCFHRECHEVDVKRQFA